MNPSHRSLFWASFLLVACGFQSAMSLRDSSEEPTLQPSGSEDADGGLSKVDAAGAKVSEGNPLCRATRVGTGNVCFPDDPQAALCYVPSAPSGDGSIDASPADAAARDGDATDDGDAPLSDAGVSEGGGGLDAGLVDAGDAGLACRVVTAPGAKISQACVPAGEGRQGVVCTRSADCAAGLECVGDGVCRAYCCDEGSCTTLKKETYCGISEVVATKQVVPVCLPVRKCTLLIEGDCGSGETCGVSNLPNTATCMPIGPRDRGESCDDAHCREGLVCLGSVGEKQCYALCHTATGAECRSHERCVAGGKLPTTDPAVGICFGAKR